ncbi:MAG TPA: AMP-binding protein [Thermoleophilaceae bacterium]|nr:AMP-binding protein [Thermoleophilaceae bacterium]
MNFARDVVDAADPQRIALIAIDSAGGRSTYSFGQIADRAGTLAGTLVASGVSRGDVVMTLIGNRPEWVHTMVACWRIGAVALPCTEQLRPADLRARVDVAGVRAIVVDERNGETLRAALAGNVAGPRGAPVVLTVPDERLYESASAPAVDLAGDEPALIVFTSGTSGEPKPIRHGARNLRGQMLQAEHWYDARPGELAWCTAASGWSLSARNAFVAPWLRGAAALLHDARFDPAERLDTIEREGVNVLCMAPTEYRAIAKRTALRRLPSLRHAVAAGEPLNPEIVERWRDEVGVEIHDGYGQTETGALTGMPLGEPLRPGAMGRPLPGIRVWLDQTASDSDGGRVGELCVDPATVPTFFLDGPPGEWRTGDRVREDADGFLWFEGRVDDTIISAGYRIGPFEVESALVSHPAVAEAAAVAAPDEERGQVVRAVVVLRDGGEGSPELARELQEHVKQRTAPYKYPRIVEFADVLPKTPSGKIKRAELRD